MQQTITTPHHSAPYPAAAQFLPGLPDCADEFDPGYDEAVEAAMLYGIDGGPQELPPLHLEDDDDGGPVLIAKLTRRAA